MHFFTNLVLNEVDILSIFYLALYLRSKTPYSFILLTNKLKLFQNNFTKHREIYDKINMSNINLLPIYSGEILKHCFPSKVNCYDTKCDNFINNSKNIDSQKICDYCAMMSKKNNNQCHLLKTITKDKNSQYLIKRSSKIPKCVVFAVYQIFLITIKWCFK